jgi:DNA-binding CsgD family transcriptional regulator/tetratricopeptide (TPR) repeat protein
VRSAIGEESALQDRRAERDVLDQLVAGARSGTSGTIVLSGAAGIGKTALLQHLAKHATGCRIVQVAGIESEMELAFAGLHQLCSPLLHRLDRLSAPQADALSTAFGLRAGHPPDRFLVGLAVLSLLSEAAEDQPLVCILDDAQWLDQASAQVLGFVARRLVAEAIVLVFAVRERSEDGELSRLPALPLMPLDDQDARALLASAMPGTMDDAVRERIIAEAQGNPLALLELRRGRTPDDFAGGFGMPADVSVASRIEEAFRRRVASLPDDSRLLLLVAAAEPAGDPGMVRAAAERLALPIDAAAEVARDAGLLDSRADLRFRHPLIRSVVYREAGPGERRRVHAALAAATDPDRDADRRVWHEAAATVGPNELVAAELERSAVRAQARGGRAAAAAFLDRAVALTTDPTRRTRRALAAAEAKLAAGSLDVARRLLEIATVGPLEGLDEARASLVRAEIAFAHDRGGDAPLLLLRAARQFEALDLRMARDTYLEAWAAALFAGELASAGGSLADVSRAAAAGPRLHGPPRPRDVLLDGLARVEIEGRAAAAPSLQEAVTAFVRSGAAEDEILRWGWLASRAANMVWDYDGGIEIATRAAELARATGALEALAVADNAHGQAAAFGGDFATARLLIAEVDAVKEATGTRIAAHAAIALAGLRGREREASALFDAVIAGALPAGQGTAIQYATWARAVLMNGLGRYDKALAAAVDASTGTPQIHLTSWALIELIEAATRIGNGPLATDALARLTAHTSGVETHWALGIVARSRALLETGDAAERLYREAIEQLGRTGLRPDLARAHLVYGEALRRDGRRLDAREHLRTAHELLSTIGMDAFADRARRELIATGEHVRGRKSEGGDTLTPQEDQIARLARDGMSNGEISAHLFLSPRTVEWHLGKVFAKLAVGSRKDLREALTGEIPRQAHG